MQILEPVDGKVERVAGRPQGSHPRWETVQGLGMVAPDRSHLQRMVPGMAVLACLFLMLLDRGLILQQFGYRYVDDDQAIMWAGAAEMAQGRFHEPCFYGQRYNTMLEGLVAVPLLWMGVGPEVALPFMTSMLALSPFALLALAMARERAYFQAALVLVLPVTLPPEFGMVSSMPRGFMGGVFFASLAILPLFSGRGMILFLSSFFAILALFVNPNAVLVLFPAGLLMLMKYGSERRFHGLSIAGAIPALLLIYFAQHFYDARPHHVVHTQMQLDFRMTDITWGAVRYLDEVAPLLWGKGMFVFVLMGVLLAALGHAGRWKPAIALLAGLVLLVASFGVNKVHDGIPSVFYPWTRMFLAVPFLLALFATQVKWRMPHWSIVLLPILSAGFFGFKILEQGKAVERQVGPLLTNYMEVREVAELRRWCMRIDEVARDHEVDLLVISWGMNKHLSNYACPCLVPGFPRTMEPHLDRRTWWLQALAPEVFPNVLFCGIAGPYFNTLPPLPYAIEQVSSDPELFLVRGNVERTDTLLAQIRVGMRDY